MAQKTVLILEDVPMIRQELELGLRRAGMRTIAAETGDEARAELAKTGDIDVVVLDIVLGEGKESESGFDFGLRLKAERVWPPEFLIHSAYQNFDYFQAALKLGAAAYLTKGSDSNPALMRVEVVAQHVRALALRRALQSPTLAHRLQSIVARSGSPEEAIERFCREILAEELESAFGHDYVLLLTLGERSVAISGGGSLLHATNASLQQLQSAVHARLGNPEPFIVNASDARSTSAHEREALQRVLVAVSGAAFVALGEIESARLSIGLVPGTQSREAVKEQAMLLDRYLQKPLIAQLLAIVGKWAEQDVQRRLEIHKREVLLDATGKFCLYQAEEIGYALRDSQDEEQSRGLAAKVEKLRAIADEMRDAGEILSHFSHSSAPSQGEKGFDLAEIVKVVWSDEISPVLLLTPPAVLDVVGHCETSDQRERAARTVSQILAWMGRRMLRSEAEGEARLFVECHTGENGKSVRVVFEEHSSRRLPLKLRESFFEPFYSGFASDPSDEVIDGGRRLGLYLAKTLAVLAGGALEDHSDELSGTLGHRFVLELPAVAAHVA